MFGKTIKYTDFNDVEREETFYFNFTKAELTEMELGVEGGLTEQIDKIIKAKNQPEIIKLFKKLVLDAYGEKSPDGRRFIKNDELKEAFSQTEAYSEIFMDLAFNTDSAVDFVNGIMPKDMKNITEQDLKELDS